MCKKRLYDIHLNSEDHKAKATGSAEVFEFPSRETYAYKGVRFFQHGNPEEPNTSATLRCDYPLPDSSSRFKYWFAKG
jgi:hypothetical protein